MELLFNGIVGVIFIVVIYFSTTIKQVRVSHDYLGAAGFPIAVSIVGLFLVVVLSIKKITDLTGKTRSKKSEGDLKEEKSKTTITSLGYTKFIAVAMLLGAYIFTMDYIGFTFSSLIFIFLSALLIGYKKYGKLVIFTLVLTITIVGIFGRVFYIALPRGVGLIKELSFILY